MKLNKGLFRDVDPIDQPANTYRDAQNLLLNKRKNALSTEEGNTLRASIPTNYTIIGKSIIYDNRHVVFLAGKEGTANEGQSEIGVFDGSSYTRVVNEVGLNFDVNSVLEAVTLINNKDQAVAYWTDNINPPRFLNIDAALEETNFIIDNIEDLRIFSTIQSAPIINLDSVAGGGSLLTGAYHFGIRYIAEDDSKTGFMQFTPPVYINDEAAVNTPDDYDGSPAGVQTSKKITLSLSNLDESYDRYQLAVIRKENDTIAEVRLLEERNIGGEASSFQYNGGQEGIESSFDEVVVNTGNYSRARTIAEADNTLYMGNLSKTNVIDYQKYANNITVSSVQKEVNDGGSGVFSTDHYGNPKISFYDKSFKRGEVYAFYISFILNNGSESEAFHIPGREAEGSELDTMGLGGYIGYGDISSALQYQVLSKPGTNNMAYWENQSETYPSAGQDEENRWEVWDVNNSGVGEPVEESPGVTKTLHGDKVRHHHFPDVIHDSNYAPFYGTSSGTPEKNNRLYTLGIELSNVKIPANIIDQIRGVKIYYARRSGVNKRILDQGIAFPLEVQNIDSDFFGLSGDDRVWMFEPPDGGITSTSAMMFDGFHSLRTRQNIGRTTYVKMIQDFTGDVNDEDPGDASQELLIKQTDQFTPRGLSEAFFPVKNNTAITYVEKGGLQEATNRGFSYDILNGEAEQGIAVETDRQIVFPDLDYDGSAQNTRVGLIAELCALTDNMYAPFDLQELVWTGKTITDLDLFDPRETGIDPDNAEGEITVTAPADAQAGEYAQGSVKIDSFSGTGQAEVQVTIDGTAVTTVGDFTEASALSDIAIAVRDVINGDPTISANWTASIDPGDNTNVLITADNYGDQFNSIGITSASVNEAGDLVINTTAIDSSGGINAEVVVTVNSVVLGGSVSVPVAVADNATKDTIATDMQTALSNDPNIGGSYTVTVDTAPSDPVITLVANANGGDYNGIIDVNPKVTGATFIDSNLSGGTLGGVEDSGIISGVYGGDTYIVRHGTRRSGFNVNGETLAHPVRYLVEYVTESSDNIKLRHEGQGDGEIYYPKSPAGDILLVEDNFGAQINVQNYVAYNPDYSAEAIVKAATPGGKLKENILDFPTRIIRSLQGDTNIGEDEGLRTFLENDFIDLSRKRGELVKLSVVNNIIIPHMERALMRTKGREEVVVGDIRAFMGAGDIFATDPDEILSTDDGFAGLQDPESAIVTPHGYFFVDRRAAKVFLLTDQPKPISEIGMHNFFYDELSKISSDKQLIACYDNKWDRIILTNKGEWTISYYPQLQAWGSFHTYNPEYYLYNSNTFYSLQSSGIYEHNEDTKSAEFYGSNDQSYIDFIDNRSPLQSKFAVNIEYISEVEDPATNTKEYKTTFDQFRINNNYQDSGDRDIVYFTGVDGNARNVQGTWKINKFRNLIDPATGNIDVNKPWHEQERLIGKYARVKLIYNNSDNKFLYLYDAKVGQRVSQR